MKITSIILLILLACSDNAAAEASFQLPDDPRQSITYWKPHALAQDNSLVQRAQSVFSILLQGWDQSRLAPSLSIIRSANGVWAASLADGNILLSQRAIEICLQLGKQQADDLLAFVLAHELSHQRADDLWHQRFFRMMGANVKRQIQDDLQFDNNLLVNVEKKEAQADHDALILMASVGYDPYSIVDSKKFFTAWVENIWQQACNKNNTNTAMQSACHLAKQRTLRTQTQLTQVAKQSLLYEIGLQSFIAGNYVQARQYFTIYGRDYPSRQVISAIGMSYLAETIVMQQQLIVLQNNKSPNFYYPLFLEARNQLTGSASPLIAKRSDKFSFIQRIKKKQQAYLKLAVAQFESAIRLSPNYKKNYIFLAMSHLLQQNTFLLRGVIQGRYIPRFGVDAGADMLLAMNQTVEGKLNKARQSFAKILSNISKDKAYLSDDLIRYAVFYNMTALLEFEKKSKQANDVWAQLAKKSNAEGNSLLFRFALSKLKIKPMLINNIHQAVDIGGKRLGDVLIKNNSMQQQNLWVEGEKYTMLRDTRGHHWITQKNNKIIFAWQDVSTKIDTNHINNLRIGDSSDRIFKNMGMPDRQIALTSGRFLAYDQAGIAIQVHNNKIKSWFLYKTSDVKY